MSLSDCEECRDTPCTCGHGYRNWEEGKLRDQIAMLRGVLRASIEKRRTPSDKTHVVVARPGGESWSRWHAILDVSPGGYWCDWKLIHCEMHDSDGTPLHFGEACYADGACTDIEKAEPTFSGFVKFDGCMEFDVGGDEDRRVHVCSADQDVVEMMGAWVWLLSEAHKAMNEVGGEPGVYLWDPAESLKAIEGLSRKVDE